MSLMSTSMANRSTSRSRHRLRWRSRPAMRRPPPARAHRSSLAPMPGRVIAVRVAEGASVKAHQAVVVIEAMKMEHAVLAPSDGVLASLPRPRGAAGAARGPHRRGRAVTIGRWLTATFASTRSVRATGSRTRAPRSARTPSCASSSSWPTRACARSRRPASSHRRPSPSWPMRMSSWAASSGGRACATPSWCPTPAASSVPSPPGWMRSASSPPPASRSRGRTST